MPATRATTRFGTCWPGHSRTKPLAESREAVDTVTAVFGLWPLVFGPWSFELLFRIKCRSMPANDATGSRARQPRCNARSHPQLARSAAALVLFSFLHAAAAPAAAPSDSSTGKPSYTLTAWTGQQNLSLGDVFAIAEDRDGYLWLGTSNGLVRFDGAVFTRRATGAPAKADGPVSALLGASDGSLWIGHGGAGGLTRMGKDGTTHFSAGSDAVPASASALLEDRAGTIWAGGRGGISAFRQGRWEPMEGAPALRDATVYSIYEDRDGRLWLGTSNGVYARAAYGFELSRMEPVIVQNLA